METRGPGRLSRNGAALQPKSLLDLSQDLIFWQGEAQRYQEAGEGQRALRALALQVLGESAADWKRAMERDAAPMVSQLGADHWCAAVIDAAGVPELVAFADGPGMATPDHRFSPLDLVTQIAAHVYHGEPLPTRDAAVTGLLWSPLSINGRQGLSLCFSTSRQIIASASAREILRGLGEIAVAAFVRGQSITTVARGESKCIRESTGR